MSAHVSEADPNIVFTPEYWGAPIVFSEPVPHFPFPARRASHQIDQALCPVFEKIISGEVTGHNMGRGVVYNPQDEDLARSSVYNMPYSILLADIETIRPVVSDADLEVRRPTLTDTEHVFSSPRALLMTKMKSYEDGYKRGSGRAEFQFNNGELVYKRLAAVVINAATKKGGLVPVTSYYGIRIATPSGYPETRATGMLPELQLEGLRTVDQTYEFQRLPASRPYSRRLRSLELCASGQQVRAESPSFSSRFLGRFAVDSA